MLKRMISLMLCLTMVMTMVPVQVFSTEEITEPTEAVILEESGEMMEESETETENLEEAVPTDPPYTPTVPSVAPTEDPNEDVVSPEEPVPTELPTEPTENVPVIDPDAIVNVEWTLPYKLKYIVNRETLDTTGCTVMFIYGDGHKEIYDVTPDMVTGFDNTILGKQYLTAMWNDHGLEFRVEIIEEPKPNHMWFNSENVKSDYLLGESLDLSGGTLQVYYSDGSKSYVPIAAPGVQVTGYDPNLLGQQIVTISYQGLITEFYVTVSAVSGKCGDKLYFDFDEDTGTLNITGSGAMYNYDWDTPWRGYARKILTVKLPDGLTSLGNGAFACCSNLTTINLPDSLTTIGDHALEECHSLTRLVIPGSVKYIGVYALCACINLTDLVLPEGIETIDMYAFMGCHALENVVLPESLKHLGGGAFQYCTGLEEAQLPETIDNVPWHTFIDCSSLKEITIPKTVTEISYYAFAGCTSLETVTFEGSAPRVDAGLFGDCYPFNYVTADAWYPGDDTTWTDAAKDSMGGDLNWRTIDSGIHVTGGTLGIDLSWSFNKATGVLTISGNGNMPDFSGSDAQGNREETPWYPLRDQITSVVIKEGVGSIGSYAFRDCSKMEAVSISSTVVSIHYDVFIGCTALETITVSSENPSYCVQNGVLFTDDMTMLIKYPAQKQNTLYVIPDSVTNIRSFAFEGNSWLKKVSIPDGITGLEDGIFAECTALTEITIPESVNWTNPYIFRNCTSLTKVVLPKSITWLGEWMFANCTSLKTVVMPEKMEGIAVCAFMGCSALEEIVLPEGLQELWTGAFQDCTSLKSITIPNSVNRSEGTIMRDYVFANCTALEQIIFAGQAPNFGDNAFEGVSATAIYPGNDVTWTAAMKKNYGGNLTWKPMLSSLELSRYPTPLIIGQGFRVMPRMTPSNAAANLTYTVSGNAELKASNGNWFIHGTAPGTATITVTDSITGLTAELTLPVVKTINLTCPQVSEPFDLSFEVAPVFTFTPTETKQYSLVLENVKNPTTGYGAVCSVDVVDTAKNIDITRDAFFWEETTSRGFYTLTAGVTYQITPFYIGVDVVEDVILRLSDVAEVTGIEIPYDTTTFWVYPEAGVIGNTIEAYFRPVQALGEITWTSSNLDVLTVEHQELNMCGFRAHQYGTSVITATCGQYSDSVTVTVKEPPELRLNVLLQDVCDNYPSGKAYRFTADESGWYRFTLTADAAMHLFVHTNDYFFDGEERFIAKLEAGESYFVSVDAMAPECDQAEYTLLAEKMGIPVGMLLEPSISNDGRVTVQAVYRPVNSVEKFETVEWDNPDVVWASSKSGTWASANIKGEGEVTVTVATENGLMASRTLAVGTCGRDLYWMFDETSGKLTIAGSGAMYDYDWEGTPWKEYCEKILSVELPDTMTALGAYAFNGCINLKELKLPEGIPEIPDFALNQCTALTSLTIPDSVKVIGDTAISDCNSLTTLVLPEGLETLESGALCWNAGLKEVHMPETLKSMGGNVFNNCTALETVEIPESISTINWGTFYGCTSLKEITIPKSVTEISYHAFLDCTSMETVIFEGSAPATDSEDWSDTYWAEPFRDLTAEAWYNGEDDSWTEEARMLLGSQLQWKPFGLTENRLMLDGYTFSGLDIVWIDGVEYAVQQEGENRYVDLPDGNAKIMTAYEYHVGNASDVHTQYPVNMKVWTLENDNGFYTATRQEDFDDILQYTGVSIRVTGKKGIRMITAMEEKKKSDLTSSGLAGYTLKEYGTAIAWANKISQPNPLVLGKSYVQSNYAYKRGVADPVFRYAEGLIHYTNVLVNFSNEQCKNDIAMRPYMILEDQRGNEVTIYGGIVERSIGYIAYLNRNAFKPDTDPYEYIWEIIHYVYGDIYDAEYVPSWTDEIK